jgi:hypothetical protein
VVEAVRVVGVAQPGEWVATAVERRLNWEAAHVEIPEAYAPEQSLGSIWRELIPHSTGASGPEELGGTERTERETFE